MSKNAIKNVIGAAIMLGTILFMAYILSPRGLTLVAKEPVPVYATEDDAMKWPSSPAIAQLSADESVPVVKFRYGKDYRMCKVKLPDGQEGFVIHGGKYTLMRDGKEAF